MSDGTARVEVVLTAPEVTDLPQGVQLRALLEKVTGNPQGIREIASTWRSASFHPANVTSALINEINDVDLKWEGDSADAFDRYMRLYPKAGVDFNTAVIACATELVKVATALENAQSAIREMCDKACGSASAYMGDYLLKHAEETVKDPDKALLDAKQAMLKDPGIAGLMKTNVETATSLVQAAENAATTARNTLNSYVKPGTAGENAGFGFFSLLPYPGGADFDPGDKKVIWKKTKTSSQQQTQSSGGSGSGSGSGSGTGGDGGAPTERAPAPKAEVAEWIKQALTIIKSPEMADTMRERGIDVSDLDANDPADVQRIWTIIYHESGGNPGAINTWDINAKNGTPSQGLMQTIPPTFNTHALPGHGKILDPVDNIIAGVLYTYSRYGNLGAHPGIASLERGGGYRPY
ncbi:transglycosylase SLT domain-containing protein [Nonomuraea endophytica]|uniref:transglycosylase SLT domain-containing protein n=1 Tax=Nonomuraea endophytica TaxID=714136 RepID=UPI0037C72550